MKAKYISPLTNFGFSKIFGEEANKALLINFLNDLLPIEDKIININFKKNQQSGRYKASRSTVYDIFCEDEKKNQFIVEMQNARQNYFADRAVFYSSFPIQEQAENGLWNFKLQEVYCVGLLGFNLKDKPLKGEEMISEYLHMVKLKDQKNHIFYDKLTYVYVELPKFCKSEEEIETHFEKWLYFLKNLENFEEIPNVLKENVFEDAFKIAEIANFTEEERMEYESSLKYYRDNINTIQTAIIEGIAEGKAEVLAKRKAEGIAAAKVEVAENMIKLGIADDVILQVTGLTKDALEEIRRKLQ